MGRTHVILADDVIDAIDTAVGARGRSSFLEQAAREKLERMQLEEALRQTAGIARGRQYRHWQTRKKASQWVRDGRATEAKR